MRALPILRPQADELPVLHHDDVRKAALAVLRKSEVAALAKHATGVLPPEKNLAVG